MCIEKSSFLMYIVCESMQQLDETFDSKKCIRHTNEAAELWDNAQNDEWSANSTTFWRVRCVVMKRKFTKRKKWHNEFIWLSHRRNIFYKSFSGYILHTETALWDLNVRPTIVRSSYSCNGYAMEYIRG